MARSPATIGPILTLIGPFGDPDDRIRKTPNRSLEKMGQVALAPLRVAAMPANVEQATRAHDAVSRITARLENERLIRSRMAALNLTDATRGKVSAKSETDWPQDPEQRRSVVISCKETIELDKRTPFWVAFTSLSEVEQLEFRFPSTPRHQSAPQPSNGPSTKSFCVNGTCRTPMLKLDLLILLVKTVEFQW